MAKQVLVTGATGFIGGHVAAELLQRGYQVRVLVREQSDPGRLVALGAQVVRGHLLDTVQVERAVAGCDAVFHLAADFRLWAPDEQVIYQANVEGTRQVLAAALAAGVPRIVYTSTVAVLAPNGDDPEPCLADLAELKNPYERSKWLAEQEAQRLAQEGLPLVIVYPSIPVGPGDRRPTPSGQIIVDFLRGRLPFYVELPMNIVAVEDVAAGHILALEQGRIGQGYILGGQNTTLGGLFAMLARITGRRGPWARVPVGLAFLAALFDQGVWSRLTHRPPRVSLASVRMARRRLCFDSSKAVRELGLPRAPIESALERAVAWFREHGYV
jgi:dihydroflavonol-4-reductase